MDVIARTTIDTGHPEEVPYGVRDVKREKEKERFES